MFVSSVVALVATSAWWWGIFALVGLLYVVMGVRQLRRYRAVNAEHEVAAGGPSSSHGKPV